MCHCAVFVPHSPPIRKSPAAERRRAERCNSSGRDGVLERNASVKNELAPPGATPTLDTLPRRLADFDDDRRSARLCGEGPARAQLPRRPRIARARLYLCRAARGCARPRASLHRARASSLATGSRWWPRPAPDFAACFFGAVYAGAWPVPLPLPTSFGGRDAYVDQLAVQLKSCDAALFLYPAGSRRFLQRRRRQGRRRRAQLGIARRASIPPHPTFRRPARTTSPICNIRADRRASRTASRSPTARFSTTFTRTASA